MSNLSQLKQSLEGLRDQPDQLIEIILRQAGVIEEQQKKIQELEALIKDLNDKNNGLLSRVENLEKTAARQAAPFRIKDSKRVTNPKTLGRKKGHKGSHRPIPDRVDQEIDVPLENCPVCGGSVEDKRKIVQYIEDIPPVVPKIIKLVTEEGCCPQCSKCVRSTHPLQVSLAEGAAGVQMGPNVLGIATELNKKHGLTMRKTCAVLKQLFNFQVSPGGLSQALR